MQAVSLRVTSVNNSYPGEAGSIANSWNYRLSFLLGDQPVFGVWIGTVIITCILVLLIGSGIVKYQPYALVCGIQYLQWKHRCWPISLDPARLQCCGQQWDKETRDPTRQDPFSPIPRHLYADTDHINSSPISRNKHFVQDEKKKKRKKIKERLRWRKPVEKPTLREWNRKMHLPKLFPWIKYKKQTNVQTISYKSSHTNALKNLPGNQSIGQPSCQPSNQVSIQPSK